MDGRKKKKNRLACIFTMLVLVSCVISLVTLTLVGLLISEKWHDGSTQQPHSSNDLRSLPNILFILIDDAGYNDIGYHNPEVKTPTLDSLAREGRILEQHYMQAICTPSRHSLMTGRYPFKTKMQHFAIMATTRQCSPVDLIFLPQQLKTQGYKTHLLGKWHLGYCQWACTPTQRGFDTFYGMYGAMADHFSHYSSPPDPRLFDWHDNNQVDFSANGTHDTDLIADRAVQLLAQHDKSEPFFMLFSPSAPHVPLQAPPSYISMYRHIKNEKRQLVCAMMTHLDDRVKDVIEDLKKHGLYENTLIIVTSDNGGQKTASQSNFPLRGGKMSLWEGGSRTFAFVAGPLIRNPGQIHNGMFHVTDWHETIRRLAGLSPDPLSDGIDQSDMIISGRGTKRTEFVYNLDMLPEFNAGQAALRMGAYKLMWGFDGLLDGWGENTTSTWRYPPNLEELAVDPGYMHDSSVPFIMPMNAGELEIYNLLRDSRWFNMSDLSSGKTRLYNLIDDPEERNDLASSARHQVRLHDMKRRVMALLQQAVQPDAESLVLRTEEMLSKSEQGSITPGWCNDAKLTMNNC